MKTDPDPFADCVDPAISCSACAAICCQLPVLLMPDDAVPDWFIDRDEYDLEIMAKGDDGWCVAIDPSSMRCTIYEKRPQVCRDFDMGGGDCRDERAAWYGQSMRIPAVSL
jgi:Fe-S-cluster containining protein